MSVSEKTARLRALRLAREAEEKKLLKDLRKRKEAARVQRIDAVSDFLRARMADGTLNSDHLAAAVRAMKKS